MPFLLHKDNKQVKIYLPACHSKTTKKMLWITEICELNSDLRLLIEILDYKLIRFLLPFWNLLRTKPWKLLNTKVSLKFWWTLFDWEMLHTGSKIISLFIHNSINSYSLINYKKSRHKLLQFNITSYVIHSSLINCSKFNNRHIIAKRY